MEYGITLLFLVSLLAIANSKLEDPPGDHLVKDHHVRHKRKVVDFSNVLWNKWDLPIHYEFNSGFSSRQESIILRSLHHFEVETCIRFFTGVDDDSPYLNLIMNDTAKQCWSHIGRNVSSGAQTMSFADTCFFSSSELTGNIVHEFGHAMGLVHEHIRPDRDQYVTIHHENIMEGAEKNFAIKTTLDEQILDAVPYDYASIMHYLAWTFSSNNELVITPRDPLYTRTISNLFKLTFYDAKAINMAYCSGVCETPLDCMRGGYQDPNDCDKCKCLEGFTGKHCELDDPGLHGHLPGCPMAGGVLASQEMENCINVSLPHGRSQSQDPALFCNWRIYTDSHYAVGFWLNEMRISCNRACVNYVEVKYKDGLLTRGPRFCCAPPDLEVPIDGTRGNFMSSEGSEISMNFADNFRFFYRHTAGFQLCFKAMPRCRVEEDGTYIGTQGNSRTLSEGRKQTLAMRGNADDPCKVRVAIVMDSVCIVKEAQVLVGKHPRKANKYGTIFTFNRKGKTGVWQWKSGQVKFPYAGYTDGSVHVDVTTTGSGFRLQASCGMGAEAEKLMEFQFGPQRDKDITITFYTEQGWRGKCF